jgi:hypothetical protein
MPHIIYIRVLPLWGSLVELDEWHAAEPKLIYWLSHLHKGQSIFFESSSVPSHLIEVKDSSGFAGKLRIFMQNPRTMLPGPDGILMKPLHRTIADRSHKTRLANISCNSCMAPSEKVALDALRAAHMR